MLDSKAWKEKNLDYEIETENVDIFSSENSCLKRKEPRLRDWNHIDRIATEFQRWPWKEKNLDYEIETPARRSPTYRHPSAWKEKNLDYEIETDPWRVSRSGPRVSWKEKNLDYEIETIRRHHSSPKRKAWKEKNLDYEIETIISSPLCINLIDLKRKEPRLRDWNYWTVLSERRFTTRLKRKEPRLRDWNSIRSGCRVGKSVLEKKRTSITRLKR